MTPSVCSVSVSVLSGAFVSESTVTGITAGTCTIAVDQAGDVNYNPATQVTQNITVGKGGQIIGAISFSPVTLAVGGTTTASAAATSNLAVTFTSTTPSICTVSGINGSTVTGIAAGTCTIAADQVGDANFNAATQVTQNINIATTANKANQTIGTISLSQATLTVGGTATASAAATSGLAVSFSSMTPSVCTVSDSTVTGVAAGTCTIAANQPGNANYNAATQVTKAVTVSSTLSAGATLNLAQSWNLLGNSVNAPLTVATTFGDATKVSTVWKWLPATGKWAFYTPSQTDGGAAYAVTKGYDFLTTINGGEGFWVNAKTAFTMQLPSGTSIGTAYFQNQADPAQNKLVKGWNLVATGDSVTPDAFNKELSVPTPAQGVIPLNVTTLWAWDSALTNWYFYAPGLDANGTLASYIASKGYLDFTVKNKMLGSGTGFWVNYAGASTNSSTATPGLTYTSYPSGNGGTTATMTVKNNSGGQIAYFTDVDSVLTQAVYSDQTGKSLRVYYNKDQEIDRIVDEVSKQFLTVTKPSATRTDYNHYDAAGVWQTGWAILKNTDGTYSVASIIGMAKIRNVTGSLSGSLTGQYVLGASNYAGLGTPIIIPNSALLSGNAANVAFGGIRKFLAHPSIEQFISLLIPSAYAAPVNKPVMGMISGLFISYMGANILVNASAGVAGAVIASGPIGWVGGALILYGAYHIGNNFQSLANAQAVDLDSLVNHGVSSFGQGKDIATSVNYDATEFINTGAVLGAATPTFTTVIDTAVSTFQSMLPATLAPVTTTPPIDPFVSMVGQGTDAVNLSYDATGTYTSSTDTLAFNMTGNGTSLNGTATGASSGILTGTYQGTNALGAIFGATSGNAPGVIGSCNQETLSALGLLTTTGDVCELRQTVVNRIAEICGSAEAQKFIDGFSFLVAFGAPACTSVTVPSASTLKLTGLSPTAITASSAPYSASLTATGSNFKNVVSIVFSWPSGSSTWTKAGGWTSSSGNPVSVNIVSDTLMTMSPTVVGTGATWAGTHGWTITLTDNTGATASRTFTVTF